MRCGSSWPRSSWGGGTPILPDGLRLDLELLDERRFAGGFVYLRYAVR